MGLAPRFLPLSRALTRASCPAALNNGLFTHWQPFDHRTVSPAAFLSPDPGPGAAPGRIGRSSILRAFDTRNDAPQEFPTDATFPPFAALGADRVRRASPAGRPCPRHALFRRPRQAPGPAAPAHRTNPGAEVSLPTGG